MKVTNPPETELPQIHAIVVTEKNGIRIGFDHCYPRFTTLLTDAEAKLFATIIINHVQSRATDGTKEAA